MKGRFPPPRNGRYELFTYNKKTYCFDDPDLSTTPIDTTNEMLEWLKAQPPELCKKMDATDTAYYLDPKLYLIWKLKWT